MSINLEKLCFKIIMLFPIFTLFQTLIPPLNKIFFALLLITFLVLYFYKLSNRRLIVFILTLFVIIYDYIVTDSSLYNYNELFYFPFFVLFYTYIGEKKLLFKELLYKEKKFVYFVICLWTFLVFISIFFKSSWIVSWGGTKYFGSFCRGVWRLSPTAVFIGVLSIVTIVFYKNKKGFLFLILPLFCLFMSGSRTYMVVGIFLFIVAWYYFVTKRKYFILTFIPICFFLFFLIINSSMIDKFNAVSYSSDSFFDPLGTLTSGRSIFWKADILAFNESLLINKIMGNGFNLIYDINYEAFGGLVWAHNDFIQCLVSHGLLGLSLYLFGIISCIKKIVNNKKNIFIFILVLLIWLFNAFFNMFYTYFCSMLCYPILLLIVNDGEKKYKIYS